MATARRHADRPEHDAGLDLIATDLLAGLTAAEAQALASVRLIVARQRAEARTQVQSLPPSLRDAGQQVLAGIDAREAEAIEAITGFFDARRVEELARLEALRESLGRSVH